MTTSVEAKLIVTTAEIIITKGVPAFMNFWKMLCTSDKTVPTMEDIESAKGQLDSADYFKY